MSLAHSLGKADDALQASSVRLEITSGVFGRDSVWIGGDDVALHIYSYSMAGSALREPLASLLPHVVQDFQE